MPVYPRSSLIVVSLLVGACTGMPAKSPERRPAVDEAAVNAVYVELDNGSLRYARALELVADGDTARAKAELKSSLDELQSIATRCAAMPGCDEGRFLSTYDRLLRTGIADPEPDAGEPASEVTIRCRGRTRPHGWTRLDGTHDPFVGATGRYLSQHPVKAGIVAWLTHYRPTS